MSRRRPRLLAVYAAVVLVAVLGAAVSVKLDAWGHWPGRSLSFRASARPPTPQGLALPTPASAAPVAAAPQEERADPVKVQQSLSSVVSRRRLGPHVAVDVEQLGDGTLVYRQGAKLVTPASTMKLLTATAALEALGPGHRFHTSVVAVPGSLDVVLVGGGDPLLGRDPEHPRHAYPARADLDTLAGKTADVLRSAGRSAVRVRYDASLFAGPSVNPRWPASYIPDDVVSPISSLWVDEGRERSGRDPRSDDPAEAAAAAFSSALRARGVAVLGRPKAARAPAGARRLAVVTSAPLRQVVQHILEVSDNEGAEVLSRQVAVAEHRVPSFAGASVAVRDVLGRLGVDTTGDTILDGSGLSRDDRLRPRTLLAVLETASSPGHPELRPVVADLPVAGFTGSLEDRFTQGAHPALGVVRAKTGTLTGVSGLVGTVTTADDLVLAFVVIADKVPPEQTLAARAQLDKVTAALAACSCSTG